MPAVKTPVGAVAKTNRIAFQWKVAFTGKVLHIYGRFAELCRKKGVAPLRELLYFEESDKKRAIFFVPFRRSGNGGGINPNGLKSMAV